jgi:hypothetical protein
VERAIDKVAKDHPEIFNFNAVQPGTDWFAIIDNDKYFAFMVQAMISFGYCSRFDGAGAGGEEGQRLLRALRHLRGGGLRPARSWVVPLELLPGRLLEPGFGAPLRKRRARRPP